MIGKRSISKQKTGIIQIKNMKAPTGKVIIKVDIEQKNGYTFADVTIIYV